jgi:hypothetical protein
MTPLPMAATADTTGDPGVPVPRDTWPCLNGAWAGTLD